MFMQPGHEGDVEPSRKVIDQVNKGILLASIRRPVHPSLRASTTALRVAYTCWSQRAHGLLQSKNFTFINSKIILKAEETLQCLSYQLIDFNINYSQVTLNRKCVLIHFLSFFCCFCTLYRFDWALVIYALSVCCMTSVLLTDTTPFINCTRQILGL